MAQLFGKEVSYRLYNGFRKWLRKLGVSSVTSVEFREYVTSDAFAKQRQVGRGTLVEAQELVATLPDGLWEPPLQEQSPADIVEVADKYVEKLVVSQPAKNIEPVCKKCTKLNATFGITEPEPRFTLDPVTLEPQVTGDRKQAIHRFWAGMDSMLIAPKWQLTFHNDVGLNITVRHTGTVVSSPGLSLSPEAEEFWQTVIALRTTVARVD